MKKNKLQEYADKSLEKYDNTEFREKLVAENYGSERVMKNTTRNWFICVATILLCVALLFATYMLFIKPPEEKHYLLENQQKVEITEQELITKVSDISVNSELFFSCQCIKDTLYNEDLYYEIKFQNDDSGEKLTLSIVTNSDYKYSTSVSEYDKQSEYLNIRYAEQYEDLEGLYLFLTNGEFARNNIKYYAIYEGYGLEPQSNFIGFLQQCIQFN